MAGNKVTKRALSAFIVAHCGGLLDLVALPVWIGVLVASYRFDMPQAGGLVTLFLIGVSIASVVWAPRVPRIRARKMVIGGFFVTAIAFAVVAIHRDWPTLAVCHFAGGLAGGTALSFTHGTFGRTDNPHRVFGLSGLGVAFFSIVFLGAAPYVVTDFGGQALFIMFALLMLFASAMALFGFPNYEVDSNRNVAKVRPARLRPVVWLVIVGFALLAMTHGLVLSFFERIGHARGFGHAKISLALMIYSVVTFLPGFFAVTLQRRFKATTIISVMPILQAIGALLITMTSDFTLYTIGSCCMVIVIAFTHPFAFGLLSRLDPSGRAPAGTPAMLMIGAALAPFVGGVLAKNFGFPAIGVAVVILVALQLLLFNTMRLMDRRDVAPAIQPVAP